MPNITTFRDLVAWQKAMDLAYDVFVLTKLFPKEELYGLTSQLRRAGVSVPSNVAEGQGRRNDREFAHFLDIAHGSICELETQVMLAERFGYIATDQKDPVLALAAEVGRLVSALVAKMRSN